ncbi:MAG: GAF domain-containing protein [Micropepsaceae bacterium]
MFAVEKFSGSQTELYDELLRQTRGILEGERDLIANSANLSALIWQLVPDLNWAGFYFVKGRELVLGPFQGKPACVRIAIGKGVCGAAVSRRETVLVRDVHAFPGHIACDAASNSELVVPLIQNDKVFGVLDLDSPLVGRFDQSDQSGVERVVSTFVSMTDFQNA